MNLFSDFQSVSAKQWEEKIIQDLKISSIDELIWHTTEGLDIRPFYNKEHLKNIHLFPLFYHHKWEIVQFAPAHLHQEEELNEYLLKSLNGGASGITMNFYQQKNFSEIFNNISLPHIYSSFNISFDALSLLDYLKDIYHSTNPFTQQKNCFINIDPIFLFEKFGEWHQQANKDFEILLQLNHIPVNGTLYKESGANVIQELSYILAHLNEYLYYLEQKKVLKNYTTIHITVSVGGSYFTEIAKFRALRILVNHLLSEYHHLADIHIHAQTTLINKSYLDIYNNLIRTTTEAMSAIFGGANSISVYPFDYPFNKVSDFSLRMARNQLLIMKEESYLDKTAEVTHGSFYIENYTHLLAEKAYQKFLEIEKQNGLITLLEKNIIQSEINKSFENELQEYITNKKVLIGVTKYSNANDKKQEQFHYSLNPSFTSKFEKLTYKRFAEYFEKQKQ